MKVFEHLVRQPAEAIMFGRRSSAERYARMTSASAEAGEAIYDRIKSALDKPLVVVNTTEQGLATFLGGGELSVPPLGWEDHVERVLGVSGACHAMATSDPRGNRRRGMYSLVLGKWPEKALALCGEPSRMWDANREDFISDVSQVAYPLDRLGDCRATQIMASMTVSEAIAEPYTIPLPVATSMVVPGRDRAGCHVVIVGKITPDMVSAIIVEGPGAASRLRAHMDSMGKFMPVEALSRNPEDAEGGDPAEQPLRQDVRQRYFEVGDEIVLKPMASQSPSRGVITSMDNGRVVVELADGLRTSMGVPEAMMRLMWAPQPTPAPTISSYSLVGMDDESAMALVRLGIDPVDVYSAASHSLPASDNEEGWKDTMLSSLAAIGINAKVVNGHALNDKGEFVGGEWIEGRLPRGNRLVIDAKPRGLRLRVGDVPDRVLSTQEPVIE